MRILSNSNIVPQPYTLSKILFTGVGLACKAWAPFNLWRYHGNDRFQKILTQRYSEMNARVSFETTFNDQEINLLKKEGMITSINSNHNKNKINNKNNALIPPPSPRPLITISNHIANLDDPIIWGGLLPSEILCDPIHMRWTLGASNILFTNPLYSKFFTLGKCIKTIRGNGVFQEAIDNSIEALENGQWLHLFPEGKVNQSGQLLRFKWGVGRMIAESNVSPIIVPIYHRGLEKAMPLGKLPYPRIFNKMEVFVGEPFDCDHLILGNDYNSSSNNNNSNKKMYNIDQSIKQQLLNDMAPQYRQDSRYLDYKLITNYIESKFKELKDHSQLLK